MQEQEAVRQAVAPAVSAVQVLYCWLLIPARQAVHHRPDAGRVDHFAGACTAEAACQKELSLAAYEMYSADLTWVHPCPANCQLIETAPAPAAAVAADLSAVQGVHPPRYVYMVLGCCLDLAAWPEGSPAAAADCGFCKLQMILQACLTGLASGP